jgi:calcium-dependent protein kinase
MKSRQIIDKSNFISRKNEMITSNYKIIKKLGEGAFSSVYLSEHRLTKIHRCVKKINKNSFNKSENENIMNEIKILKTLDHQNILKIYEYYEKNNILYLVTELLNGGDLFERLDKLKSFSEKIAAKYMKQIFSAVYYLHKKKIIHRDLKPENIMFETNDENSNLKIIDFGTCRQVDDLEQLRARMGTIYYIAPEVIDRNYSFPCDIWSCGIIMYILLSGYPPFNSDDDNEIFNVIKKSQLYFPDEEWNYISPQAKDLLKKILVKDPAKRISIKEILDHDWFKSIEKNDINKLDNLNSQKILNRMKNFNISYKLKNAVMVYFVNFFDINSEKENLIKTFLEIDKDGDGELTREELFESYTKIYSPEEAEFLVEELFRKIDFNNSNSIDFSEFLVATINQNEELNERNLRNIFNVMDSDRNGTITSSELKNFLNSTQINEESINNLIKEADIDMDGVIDFEEFKIMMKK